MTKLFMKLAPVSINFYQKQINIFAKTTMILHANGSYMFYQISFTLNGL